MADETVPAAAAPWRLADLVVIVVGDRCWGKGDTIAAARKKAQQNYSRGRLTKYFVYAAHPSTAVDEMGDFVWRSPPGADPADYRPRLIDKVGVG